MTLPSLSLPLGWPGDVSVGPAGGGPAAYSLEGGVGGGDGGGLRGGLRLHLRAPRRHLGAPNSLSFLPACVRCLLGCAVCDAR
eukprot:188249-Rhodomonas_salina.1